jgi:hypothetical protein
VSAGSFPRPKARGTVVARVLLGVVLSVLGILYGGAFVAAQFQMPDVKQMSGIPRPVTDLPAGSVSVRVIRGDLSKNIANQLVQLTVGSKTLNGKTDENGRAQFDKLPAGETVKASADVDGEHLESQEFPAPGQGGVRLMLVATDKTKGPATEPSAPPITGQVVLSNQSRLVLEPGDEVVNLYYLLDISNTARVPVNTKSPFIVDVPKEAVGTALMEGSSPQASVSGGRVRVAGPFAPGHTFVQVGCELPAASGEIEFTQRFPANLESLAVVAKKAGDAKLSSPQLASQREMPADGEVFIAATGGPVNAGQPVTLSLTGLPHHSSAPRITALTIALAIVVIGIFAGGSARDDDPGRAAERKRLIGRREKLLNDLARLESDRRGGRAPANDEGRYAARREELLAALEHVYGALDSDDAGPEPADRAGVAAPLDRRGAA